MANTYGFLTHPRRTFQKLKKDAKDASADVHLDDVHVPDVLGNTKENLTAAIAGENMEYSTLYPQFAKIAEEEGLPEIAKQIRAIAKAEEKN